MFFDRWSSVQRDLSGAEVDSHFAAAAHETLLFSFRTDRMEVGARDAPSGRPDLRQGPLQTTHRAAQVSTVIGCAPH